MKFSHLPLLLAVPVVLLASAHGQDLTRSGVVPAGISQDDWAGIHAAFDAEVYKVKPVDGGFEAFNGTQAWLTEFDGEGFLVRPTEGDWSWGLALESYGFEGGVRTVVDGAQPSPAGQRMTYGWEPNLDEWYINDRRGLEHGYTVQARPQGDRGAGALLTFELSIRGSLAPVLGANRTTVGFVDADRNEIVTYSGLHVFDANGDTQPSGFTVTQNTLKIWVEDSGASYPLTVDPIGNQQYLKASNTDRDDSFGTSVAVSGELVVVGAPHEDSSATGVDGSGVSNSRLNSGAAYIFHRRLGTWRQAAYLKASNPDAIDTFGRSVAISGNTVVVGAPFEDGDATGVNGNENTNSRTRSGCAYVFENVGGVWMQTAYVKSSNSDNYDEFGGAVSIDGDWMAVGAAGEDSGSTGVNGNEASGSAPSSGAVYVFGRNAGIWSQVAYVKASNPGIFDEFGYSVSLSGNRLVVGAISEDSGSAGVNGNQADNSVDSAGAAYVFDYAGGAWAQTAYLKAQYPGVLDRFGFNVGVSGDRVLIGAPLEDSDASGVNGDGSNDLEVDSGCAFVFSKLGGTWVQEAFLKAHNTSASSLFGFSVAIDGDLAVVGASEESSYGLDGSLSNTASQSSGAAYLFERVGGGWSQLRYQKAFNFGPDDSFGTAVALSGKRVLVGAPFEDSQSTGVGGNSGNDFSSNSGASYIINFYPIVESYCNPAVVNSGGVSGIMLAAGTEVIAANRFYVGAQLIPHNSFGYFISSLGEGYIPMAGGSQGTLCVGGGLPMGRHHGTLRQAPDYQFIFAQIDLTSMSSPTGIRPVAPGETWHFQCWYRDMNPTVASNYTDAIAVRFE